MRPAHEAYEVGLYRKLRARYAVPVIAVAQQCRSVITMSFGEEIQVRVRRTVLLLLPWECCSASSASQLTKCSQL